MNYKFEESIQKIKKLMKENGYVTSKMVKEKKIFEKGRIRKFGTYCFCFFGFG